MYIKLIDGQPQDYSVKQLRLDYPNTSFLEGYPDVQLTPLGVFRVEVEPKPPIDYRRQIASRSEPTLVDGTWRRTWTIADIPISDIRAGASLTRLEFCNALAAAGILTDVDAIQGAKGDWPSAMLTFLDYLTPEQARDAQIEWATADSIRRMHPFVLSLGSWLGLTDEQVDALFGIGV